MKLDEDIEAWRRKEFIYGDRGAQFKKLGEEVGELGEALMYAAYVQGKEGEYYNESALDEIADCAIVLSGLARMLGAEGLYEIMQPVFEKRRDRKGDREE